MEDPSAAVSLVVEMAAGALRGSTRALSGVSGASFEAEDEGVSEPTLLEGACFDVSERGARMGEDSTAGASGLDGVVGAATAGAAAAGVDAAAGSAAGATTVSEGDLTAGVGAGVTAAAAALSGRALAGLAATGGTTAAIGAAAATVVVFSSSRSSSSSGNSKSASLDIIAVKCRVDLPGTVRRVHSELTTV